MKTDGISLRIFILLGGLSLLSGCASISESTHAYLGSPKYAPSNPANIQILQTEPQQPKERLGEVILTIHGSPPREKLEEKLREGAAKLGANAVFVASDRTHIFPVVYMDYWWGPTGVTEERARDIVGVAIRLK